MSDQQRNLFDTEPEPWEADDQAEQLVAGVVLATGPAQEFDYLVPDALRDMVEPGRRVMVPLGKGNRQVQGYCVRVESRLAGPRPLKPLAEVVDRRSLLSPAMLRLTRWIADYYLCGWGQVLETVLPAGVRGQAGTRMATLLTLDPRGAEQLAAGEHAGQASRDPPRVGRCRRTAHAAGTGPCGELLAGAHRHVAPQRSYPLANRAGSLCPAGRSGPAAGGAPAAQPGSAEGARHRAGRAAFAAASHVADPRRDRQRQDGGLYPGHRRGGALRPAGDRAGAGDQPHAANRRAFSPAVRGRGRAAQPPERRRPALALAADRRRPGVGGRRRTQRDLRPHAAAWA